MKTLIGITVAAALIISATAGEPQSKKGPNLIKIPTVKTNKPIIADPFYLEKEFWAALGGHPENAPARWPGPFHFPTL